MVRARRPLTLLAVAPLVAGGVALAPAPAQAIVANLVVSDISFQDAPNGVTCTRTGLDVTPAPVLYAKDGVPATSNATGTTTFTGPGGDVTDLQSAVSTTITATTTHVHVSASTDVTLTTHTAVTKCGASVMAEPAFLYLFDLTAPMLVTIEVDAHNIRGDIVAGQQGLDLPIQAEVGLGNGHSHSVASVILPAGTGYEAGSELQTALLTTSRAETRHIVGDLVADISFTPVGTALDAQTGAGSKYVGLGAQRDCAGGTLPLTWSKKAGTHKARRIKKAVVSFDGARVATVKKPKAKQVSMIPLPPGADGQVQVVFKVKGKGSLFAQREYVRCS